MPRIRSVRPETWSDPTFCQLSIHARYLYMALWTYVDDDGRGRFTPKAIEGYAFPYDDLEKHSTSIETLLRELTKSGRIVLYQDGSDVLFHIPTFNRHQKPSRHTPSRLPAPLPASGPKAVALAATSSPVLNVLATHFGAPERAETLDAYRTFIRQVVADDSPEAAEETERRIINMKLAHSDNIRAWTLNNLRTKWEHWSVERIPVPPAKVAREIRRTRSRAELEEWRNSP